MSLHKIRNQYDISSAYRYKIDKERVIIISKTINRVKFPPRRILSIIQKRIVIDRLFSILLKKYFYLWFVFCVFIGFALNFLFMEKMKIQFSYPLSNEISAKIYTYPQLTLLAQENIDLTTSDSTHSFTQVAITKYTLQPGDVLLHIARKYNKRIDTLISWNKIKDARRIWAGDEIIIPSKDGLLHTVRKGDTIASLARKYDVTAVSMLDANNLQSNIITIGTKLFIPDAKMNEFELGLVLGTIFSSPTKGILSSRYGYRTSPITGIWSFHGGIDIANNTGTPILNATHGVVSYVAYNTPVYGTMVLIRHAGGFQTLYAHLSKVYVKKGQRISRGRTVGVMGNTGLSTGPHLHFSIILNGQTVNPLRFIRLR